MWMQTSQQQKIFQTHLNEGLEGEWMEFLGPSKWLSNFRHRHGGHVSLIVKDILFRNIDTLLHEVFKGGGK